MKRVQILSAVVLAMALTACTNNELDFNKNTLGENDFGFSVQKVAATRSSEQEAVSPVTFEMGNTGFYLQEEVTELDYAVPETKGTPIYTENIEKYYTSINVVGYKVGGTDPYVADAAFSFLAPLGEGTTDYRKVYGHHYASDFWPAENESQELYFYLRAPGDYISSKTQNLTYGTSDGSIAFDYTSPYKGSEQKDMLFTSRTLTKEQYYNNYHPNGAPVTFFHALTAVKFRSGSSNDGTTKTIITGVKFSGLKDKGHCVVTPTEGQVSKQNVKWSGLDMDLGTFSQTFANPTYNVSTNEDPEQATEENKSNSDGTVGNKVDGNNDAYLNNFAGTSLVNAAADKNLNDENGSLTFWFIPQEITKNVTLEVTFRVKTPDTPEGTEITHKINFGEQLVNSGKNHTWEAGQLRTYTLDPKDVDVEIFDSMQGLVKSGLHVTNTGNVDEYVRMMLIGNWYGWLPGEDPATDEPSILVGYKTETSSEMVTAWYREDDTFSTGFDDTFTGGRPSGDNKWIRGTGSYFYYPDVIGAGDKLAQTTALFQSYTLNQSWIPDIWIPSSEGGRQKAIGVHLVMECVIQAVSAKKPDGSGNYETCWDAWTAAIYPDGDGKVEAKK